MAGSDDQGGDPGSGGLPLDVAQQHVLYPHVDVMVVHIKDLGGNTQTCKGGFLLINIDSSLPGTDAILWI